MKYWKLIIFVVLALGFIALAVRTSFFNSPRCQTFECFETYMQDCKSAQYLNDDNESTWRYHILGAQDGACVIEVTLLQSKTGELGIEQLTGYSMECGYPKGVVAYPEKDLGMCHGRLKEEMQGLIIKRLHTYIVDNLGEIDQSLTLVK
jgi:hypothetical protein